MEYKLLQVQFALLALVVSGILCCSDLGYGVRSEDHSALDEEKIYYSDYVVFGKAGKKVKGAEYPFSAIDGVRTIEVTVFCVYKQKVPITTDKIYVTAVGNKNNQVPGCPPAPLSVGDNVILFLRKLEDGMANLYEIEFKPNGETDDFSIADVLDELTFNCGLNLTLPTGGDEEGLCSEPMDAESCNPFSPEPPQTTTPNKAKPDATEKPMETTSKPKDTDKPMKTTSKAEMKPTSKPEMNDDGSKSDVGKPIENDKNDTYNTEKEGSDASSGRSEDPTGGAAAKYVSQSVVLLISVLFILV